MPDTPAAVMRIGARRPRTSAVVITTWTISQGRRQQLLLACVERLRLRDGVAAGGRAGLVNVQRHEGGPQALDLFAGGGTDIIGLRDGAQASGGRDGLQAGHARAEHEYARGRQRAGGGHHQGKQPWRGLGGQHDRLVNR